MQVLINILQTSSIYMIIAISFIIIYYPAKAFYLSHAAIISLGAYFCYFLSVQLNQPLWLSVLLAIVITSLFGGVVDQMIYKPLRKRNAIPLAILIASLGIYIILLNLISLIWDDSTKSIRTSDIVIGKQIAGSYISNIQVITIITGISIVFLYLLFLKFTSVGRKLRAISSNEELSDILGINSNWYILIAFIIGSATASVSGILVAYDINMTPTMGFKLLLYGIVAMIIGGVGSTWGLVGGAFLLATAQHLGAYYIDSKWMDAIAYLILILFLIWKPLGFSGKRLKKIDI
ncbi:MAG: branched-chain amino acid ABC transporter permease [Bacteroidia bacterium]|nr:branched-chain amino acid ABC transporter permease [Bacteroidia bacterium]